MNHLDDGTIQAFLDDELRPGERADVAEHLLGCPQCRSAKDELVQAHSVFADAVSVLDVEAPSASAPALHRGLSAGGRAFVKAAGLILVVSAAASAAVPGSPVREWIVRAVRPEPVQAPAALESVEPAPAPAPMPPAPAGVSLPVTAPVEVALSDLDGTTIRLVETDGDRVTVSALGTEVDPSFSTAADRIEVRGAVGGEITVEVPRSVQQLRLMVDGQLYADREAGELRVHVPAETVDGARVWR
jgi:hypothetical protein